MTGVTAYLSYLTQSRVRFPEHPQFSVIGADNDDLPESRRTQHAGCELIISDDCGGESFCRIFNIRPALMTILSILNLGENTPP